MEEKDKDFVDYVESVIGRMIIIHLCEIILIIVMMIYMFNYC